jgi:hypothetical protein
MRTLGVTALTAMLGVALASQSEAASLKSGAVYCISKAAIEEHMEATAAADSDRVYGILWKRKLCDYTQAVTAVTVLEDRSVVKWVKVKLSAADGPWRKGSKIQLPKDLIVYVRRNSVSR